MKPKTNIEIIKSHVPDWTHWDETCKQRVLNSMNELRELKDDFSYEEDNNKLIKFKADGFLLSGKSFSYVDEAVDMIAFIRYISVIYPDFTFKTITVL